MSQFSDLPDIRFPFHPMADRQLTHLHQPDRADATDEVDFAQSVGSTGFGKLWRTIMKVLEPNREPQFQQRCDRKGNIWWECYDPISGRTFYFASDDEARIWLEQSDYFR